MAPRHWRTYAIATLLIVVAAMSIELAMGRVPWCRCGYVKVWHGIVSSSENSQHITDWYTFSHIIHGIAFYGLLWLVARRLPPGVRFVIAVVLEAAWEVFENTPLVINRYRAATIALDYFGDSVLNSVSDIVSMVLGFWMARRSPVWISVGVVILMELAVAAMIRDNLTLNIIMLIYPLEAIKQWQMGGDASQQVGSFFASITISEVLLVIGGVRFSAPPMRVGVAVLSSTPHRPRT